MLLDEHFPGSVQVAPANTINTVEVSSSDYAWLSVPKIRLAIDGFSPNKTAGLDNLKPIVLQHLPSQMLERLGELYKASLDLEYVPKQWRESKAIFIPKAGKDDYSHVRSWRPICLMSFVFKTLERLILWHLEETVQ